MVKEDARLNEIRGFRDRIRTNRQKDGSLSAGDVEAILADAARELGEDFDAQPPASTDPAAGPIQGARGVGGGPKDSSDPGSGVDHTPGRDVLPGTPPTDMENPNVPTGGPVGDNIPAPGVSGVHSSSSPGTRDGVTTPANPPTPPPGIVPPAGKK